MGKHTHQIELGLSNLAEAGIDGLNDTLDASLAAAGSTHEAVDISYKIVGCVPGDETSEGSVIVEATYTNDAEPYDESESESEDVTWSELEFRPDGEFYIERLKASTSEYWPYRVEAYEVYGDDSWRVFDVTTGTPIGLIRPGTQNEAFKAVVNGYAQTQVFTNLKAAVIYVATEYNGV